MTKNEFIKEREDWLSAKREASSYLPEEVKERLSLASEICLINSGLKIGTKEWDKAKEDFEYKLSHDSAGNELSKEEILTNCTDKENAGMNQAIETVINNPFFNLKEESFDEETPSKNDVSLGE